MSNYNLKAKRKSDGEIEVFTAIDNSSSYSYLSEDLYTHYSSKEFNDLYDIVEECKCREMTCPKGCKAYHTHKTFWCEHCYEDRNLPKPMTQEEYDDSKHLITKSIKPDNNWQQELDRICEEVKSKEKCQLDHDENPEYSKGYDQAIDDIINIIKK